VAPYVATWLQRAEPAFLARAGATEPGVTLILVRAVDLIDSTDHGQQLTALARLFEEGAEMHGVRHLVSGTVQRP
jgi:hypothetical protein